MPSTETLLHAAEPAAGVAALTDCIVVPRFIARAAARNSADAEALLTAAGLPTVLSDPDTARTPSSGTFQLWREVLTRTGRPDAGLLVAARYRTGLFDLLDYLLSTAPTLGEGLALAASHVHLVSSNSRLTTEVSGDEVTVTYRTLDGKDDLRAVVAEFVLAVLTEQLRHGTGKALSPTRVSFTHPAPQRSAGYADSFGAARIDFGAPADSITLHRRELELPMVTADPALAAIIRRTAAAYPPPRPVSDSAVPGLRTAILAQLADGRPSLTTTARRLAVSPRTLQRRLGESGTTWRAELDEVRRERSAGLRGTGAGSAQRAAAHLGFAETRSLRRAMNRWDARDPARSTEPMPGQESGTP
jgi:AraC-like DNA-binding protein